jgi:lipopolysaccharide biosynthesis regulator YciM
VEFEAWWLLAIPLFFALGWLAARIDISHLLSESKRVPASYFKGLNFLLSEQPDKAIEAFIEVVKVDAETIDLHFALGGLFRRRGELDRAIRMHQNLLERPDLGQEARLKAMRELGIDYLKAGILDRAETIFRDLLSTPYKAEALGSLKDILVQEREWESAIEVAQQLDRETGVSSASEIAHFHCELALTAMGRNDMDKARSRLEEALTADRKCVRAQILMGDLESANGDYEAALRSWSKVEAQHPAYLPLFAHKMLAAYRHLNRLAEGTQFLRTGLMRLPSQDLQHLVYEAVLDSEGPEEAYRLMLEAVRRHPTLRGLDDLLQAKLAVAPRERRSDMNLIKDMVHRQATQELFYQCGHCGFKARQFFWHCPACNKWGSIPPDRRENG